MSKIVRPEPQIDLAIEEMLHAGAHVHVLNTTIIPPGADGVWRVCSVDLSYIHHILLWLGHAGSWGFIHSHVGHESTAAIASELLRDRVEVDRRPWNGEGIGLAIQLNGRPPEGKILSREEVEAFGYTLRLVFREPADGRRKPGLREFAEVLLPVVRLLRHGDQGLHAREFEALEEFVRRLPSGRPAV